MQELLDARADVLVVSPSLTDTLSQLAGAGAIRHLPRPFRDDDVQGCALVIGATDQVELKAQVATAARRRAVWVNVVDTPASCDFIAPALVRRGALQIAISTGGNSPSLAKRLRHGLEQLIGPEYGVLVDVLGRLRAAHRWWAEPPEVRKATSERLMDASGLPLLTGLPSTHARRRREALHRPGGGGTEYARVAENASVAAQAPQRERRMQLTRRDFLAISTTGTMALLLAGLPRGWIGGVYAGDGPETPKMRIGIIALTDCSSIVMAHELGLFKKYGIESTISKEASWAVIRDR